MTKIYEDVIGLYARVGGWVVRPTDISEFKRGDITEGYHFGGSPLVGMGKEPGRGNYTELWTTTTIE